MDLQTPDRLVVAAQRVADAITTRDPVTLRGALAPEARLRALLPAGLREWEGSAAIADRFERWFGDGAELEVVESTVGEVGGRVQLRWRLRVRADRLGPAWQIVEQVAYADVDEQGQVAAIDLLCTGFRPETARG